MDYKANYILKCHQKGREMRHHALYAYAVQRPKSIGLVLLNLDRGNAIIVHYIISCLLYVDLNTDSINQLCQWRLLPNLSHDQTVCCNPSIPRTQHWLEQQCAKGLP